MSSGIYTALSGAVARMNATEIISNNLSNINSNGFKKQRMSFSSVLSDAVQSTSSRGNNFNTIGAARIDFEQGVIADTGRDLDFAIIGTGFFRVQRGAETFYTRTGTFSLTAEGTLVDNEGNAVMSADNQPLVIPDGPFHVDEEGRILNDEGEIGQIPIFDLPLEDLTHDTAGRFVFNGAAAAVTPSLDSQILQGSLERSNVNLMEEAALMINNMRSFESYNKVMKNYYDLNAKSNEIATL
ncbi:MAG: flagellar basal-body rod protein FlgF [Desulfuromonadaceae bacterium]|nr:flagellar basal-body rod protein FlgF [Desulfuromonas sp.]MDY0185011.1 flagellar basal-body rod protein FlgF [Desulfuromonadaceae bacterium]